MIKITCESCHKPLSIDETKLPMQRVSFPCPSCKAKLSIDRRDYEAGAAPAPAAAAPSSFDASHSDPVNDASADDDMDHLGDKALIVGADHPAIRQAAKAIGLQPMHFASVESARDYYVREFPTLVFLNPAQIAPPPLNDFAAILSLTPSDRRRGFFVLVAENLRTFDGNAAFLYGVNLILATKDLASFPQIYRDANHYHQRLYANFAAITA